MQNKNKQKNTTNGIINNN